MMLIPWGLIPQHGIEDGQQLAHASDESHRWEGGQQKTRDPQLGHTRKGKQYYFGAKAHIGVDADSG